MTSASATTADPPEAEGDPIIRVNGNPIELSDRTPTGSQILTAAGLRPAANYALLRWPNRGPTNEIGLEDVLELPSDGALWEFFAIEADGISYFTLDEERYAWAGVLDEATIRRIGRVTEDRELWFERTDQPDRLLEMGEVVKLEQKGVERFYTRKRVWRLDVQGEPTQWDHPQVLVRDALVKAGFDPSKPWVIMFKVKDQPIRPVEQTETIDLSQPGIERLRVRPKNVNNGDVPQELHRDFSLLPKDAQFLTASGFQWRTVIDGHRWLIVDNYPLPGGYNVQHCQLAIDIPSDYPTAQLDMFFCDPELTANGVVPPQTQHRQTINGAVFQRWSRHRPGGEWSPTKDNLATHFALIEQSIGREVGA